MPHVGIQLDDLPDEILMYIFNKLDYAQVLYSLVGVNQRLNTIVYDPSFIRDLRLLLYSPDDHSISQLPDPILHRLCSEVLPTIGHQVKTLHLEGTSIVPILSATNYPHLHSLDIYNIDEVLATNLFIDDNPLTHIFKNQISSLCINFIWPKCAELTNTFKALIFKQILTSFTNLKYLKWNADLTRFDNLWFNESSRTVMSSNLLELHVGVWSIEDCLYLLDGRFDQLRALYVKINMSSSEPLPTEHEKKLLPNLRIFSLKWNLLNFNGVLVPVLQRMINLEQLYLNIEVACDNELIDGNTLKKSIINYMPRLDQFLFNIYSTMGHSEETIFVSNEYIQNTFKDFYNNQIISCVDHFQEHRRSQCRIYTYPYKLKRYKYVTNNFPGGLFNSVTEVSLYDERPFEDEFFLRIAQSFPFMKTLRIYNYKRQKNKKLRKTKKNENQPLSIIKYSNLTVLDLGESHHHYVELCLLNTKTFFPNNVRLLINYRSLKRVTNNFRRNATRANCAKLGSISFRWPTVINEHTKAYFPHACIEHGYLLPK